VAVESLGRRELDDEALIVALSTTRSKINDAQPQADHGHLSNFVNRSY
jgi:hypothetical protein